MQQEQPQYYATLAGHLSADDQAVIQNVMVKAEEVAQAAQQAALLAQQQAQLGGIPGAANGGAS
jgi:hypothetical protein